MKTINVMPRNQQDSFQAKELQKFFDKVKGVMLIPGGKQPDIAETPLLCIVLEKEVFMNFKDYGINKIIIDLLDDKYPVLSIKVERSRTFIGLSIVDIESGLTFKLPNQPMGQALVEFLQATKYDDKIPMMLAYFDGGTLIFESTIKTNVLLILDGYIFE